MSPIGDHTDHVIFIKKITGHQYIISRRGRDEMRTGSKTKIIFITPARFADTITRVELRGASWKLRIKFYPMANVTEQVIMIIKTITELIT